ncbi:hypothetical protein HYE82_18760 [Streptomyces sp. BR123]|uniref:hypothetical protein n=1 Tax=Streptomyces sp. BR123 TaxID=2749828 RepID=UPI0015C48A9C|nr:hypothetical protein [Streptomyces sp. BR123]NXY96394.1 hypothetical protein [Streptomyces sp. BR123]
MLRVIFEIARDLTVDRPIRVTEGRGWVRYELCEILFPPEAVAALNSATAEVLAGGQWFQLWRGDIISMHSPETEGRDGGVHRGPLAHEAAGPGNR